MLILWYYIFLLITWQTYISFFYTEIFVFWWDKYFLTWLFFSIILYITDILIMFLWIKLYKKKRYDLKINNFLTYIFAFLFVFFPIINHIWAFLLWFNNKSKIKNSIIILFWYIIYILFFYILYYYNWDYFYLFENYSYIFSIILFTLVFYFLKQLKWKK
jgi:hypothetical protein